MTYNTEHLVIYIILDESVTAYLETHLNGRYTIRHRTCSILIEDGERCSSCMQWHHVLSKYNQMNVGQQPC